MNVNIPSIIGMMILLLLCSCNKNTNEDVSNSKKGSEINDPNTDQTQSFALSGSISGLVGSITLKNNVGEELTLVDNGLFQFESPYTSNSTYIINIVSQPEAQICVIKNASGDFYSGISHPIIIKCMDSTMSIQLLVEGLNGSATILISENNDIKIDENGSLEFTVPHTTEQQTLPQILTQPKYQLCQLQHENDNLHNSKSIMLYLSCRDKDTDGDGLTDWVEISGWQVKIVTPSGRYNGGLMVSSDPTLTDTDGDGLSDFDEKNHQENNKNRPLDPNNADTDADGISDGELDPDQAGAIVAGPDLNNSISLTGNVEYKFKTANNIVVEGYIIPITNIISLSYEICTDICTTDTLTTDELPDYDDRGFLPLKRTLQIQQLNTNLHILASDSSGFTFSYSGVIPTGSTELKINKFSKASGWSEFAIGKVATNDIQRYALNIDDDPELEFIGFNSSGVTVLNNSDYYTASTEFANICNRTNGLASGFATGDSFANDENDWPQKLARSASYECFIQSKGRSGDKLTTGISGKFASDISESNFHYVIVQGGINDITSGVSAEDMLSAVQTMFQTAQNAEMGFIILNVAPFGNSFDWSSDKQGVLNTYNTELLSWANSNSIPYVDIYNLLLDETNNLHQDFDIGDGKHPNAMGMQAIADAIRIKLPENILAMHFSQTNSTDWQWDNPRFVGQLNRDTIPDIIGFGDDHVYAAIGYYDQNDNRRLKFSKMSKWDLSVPVGAFSLGWDGYKKLAQDLDGDGDTDIFGFSSVTFFSENIDSWEVTNGQTIAPDLGNLKTLSNYGSNAGWGNLEHPRFILDINGDSQKDIVGFGNTAVIVSFGQLDPTNRFSFVNSQWDLPEFCINSQVPFSNNSNPRLLGDVNGDGLPDIVAFGHNNVMVSINNMPPVEGQQFNYPYYDPTAGSWSADNQKTQIFRPSSIALSNAMTEGQGWFINRTLDNINHAGEHPRTLADMNNDGYLDIVGFFNDGIYVAINITNPESPQNVQFAQPVNWYFSTRGVDFDFASSNDHWYESNLNYRKYLPRGVSDINGDGNMDIFGFSRIGLQILYTPPIESAN